MIKFIMYDIDRHEKIAEAYDKFMCESMLEAFWDYQINNIQIQRIKTIEKEVEGE